MRIAIFLVGCVLGSYAHAQSSPQTGPLRSQGKGLSWLEGSVRVGVTDMNRTTPEWYMEQRGYRMAQADPWHLGAASGTFLNVPKLSLDIRLNEGPMHSERLLIRPMAFKYIVKF